MQIIVEVEAGVYASEQHKSRISAPDQCPNCGVGQSLEAHGHYWRLGQCGFLRQGITNGGAPFFCPVLRGDGQLPAALRAAISSRL